MLARKCNFVQLKASQTGNAGMNVGLENHQKDGFCEPCLHNAPSLHIFDCCLGNNHAICLHLPTLWPTGASPVMSESTHQKTNIADQSSSAGWDFCCVPFISKERTHKTRDKKHLQGQKHILRKKLIFQLISWLSLMHSPSVKKHPMGLAETIP